MKNKVFVGNVPFHCTREEFQDCFKHLDGFVTADIIKRYKSKLSRGFGFVVFENKEQANDLMKNDSIKLKDRVLRFSPYSFEKSFEHRDDDVYQVFVNNLKMGTTDEQLNNALSYFGNIVTSSIKNKNDKTTGVVTFESLDSYKKALYKMVDINDIKIEIVPYVDNANKKYQKNNKYKNPKNFNGEFNHKLTNHFNNCLPRDIYREGFKAGYIVGFEQGVKQGQSLEPELNYLDQDLTQYMDLKNNNL